MSIKVEGKKTSHGSILLEKQKKFELYAIFLVFISLVFTVFWGKLYGIILISIFLYFFSLCNSNYRCQKNYTYTKDGCKGSLWKVCSKWSTIKSINFLRDNYLYFLRQSITIRHRWQWRRESKNGSISVQLRSDQ
jgi:hypothetical protein